MRIITTPRTKSTDVMRDDVRRCGAPEAVSWVATRESTFEDAMSCPSPDFALCAPVTISRQANTLPRRYLPRPGDPARDVLEYTKRRTGCHFLPESPLERVGPAAGRV